jgi:toxin ParE1/3/4
VKLRIYGPARQDLEDAYRYIAADSPRSAERVIGRVLTALQRLPDMPRIGRRGRVPGTRELVITRTSYLAIY